MQHWRRSSTTAPAASRPPSTGGEAVAASASGCKLSGSADAISFERDAATGLYRISSGGALLTESGNRAALADPDGSPAQLWSVSDLGGGRYSVTSAWTSCCCTWSTHRSRDN